MAERPNNLARARRSLGLTQRKVAEMAGVSHTTISMLENGRSAGSVALWERLESILMASRRELLGLSDVERK